jgi:hypothetical protein
MLQHKLVLLHLYNINCFFVWIAFLLLPAMEMSPATSPFFVSKVAPKRSGTVKLVYHERSRAEYYPQNHLGTPCKRLRPVYGVGQKNVCFMPPLRYHKHLQFAAPLAALQQLHRKNRQRRLPNNTQRQTIPASTKTRPRIHESSQFFLTIFGRFWSNILDKNPFHAP